MFAFIGGTGERSSWAKKAVMAFALPAAVVATILVVAMVAMAGPAWAAPASFSGPTNFGAGDGPQSVAAADLNGDGKPDLATANFSSRNVSVLLNTTPKNANAAPRAASDAYSTNEDTALKRLV